MVAASLVTVTAVWSATEATHRVAPPPCLGIGFGCEPDAVTTAALVSTFLVAPAVVVSVLLVWAGWWAGRRGWRFAEAVMWAPAVACWAFTGVVSAAAVWPVARLMAA